MPVKANIYRSTKGLVLAGNAAMHHSYVPKVKICQQIIGLSAAAIAECFGVTGEAYIEGIRHAMIEHLDQDNMPAGSWREIASRIQGLSEA